MNSGPLTQSKRNNFTLLLTLVKLFISIAALWLIYKNVFSGEQNKDYLHNLLRQIATPVSAMLFVGVICLMLLNWSLEAWKWKFMIGKIEAISFPLALRAVFTGITISFFTPNRIGEYAGRVAVLSPGKRWTGALITILENTGQLIVTLVSGCIALFFFRDFLPHLQGIAKTFVGISCIVFPLVVVLLFLYSGRLLTEFGHKRWVRKYASAFADIEYHGPADLAKLIVLSVIRYFVFCFQFYLLIELFGFRPDPLEGFMLITMTFFVMTVVPTIAFTELSVRGAVAVYFFGFITIDTLPVLHAAFAIWFVNLVIPATVGSLLILSTRWKLKN